MPILHAIVLGVVQGLSEFLPISSSGHLLLVPWLFGWDDFQGNTELEKTFDLALHLGTFVGALVYFRHDVVRLARAALLPNRVPAVVTGGTPLAASTAGERRLAWLLVLASVPAALVGALFDRPIEEHLGQIWLIAIMLIAFGLVLWWADRLPDGRDIREFRVRDALLMGGGQALALQPGISRSGATMSVGRWLRFDRDAAARVSFLMSLPITGGAVAYKGLKLAADGFPSGFAWPFFWGIVASGITGYIAVWGLLRLVQTRSFTPFVVYRVIVGLGVLALVSTSFR
jgi:undecaprenyl-diphosphatase